MSVVPMRWAEDGLLLLDQRCLPLETTWLTLNDWQGVRDAIRDMAVRGAPAIGIAAAYGMALAARSKVERSEAATGLAASRPTAVNLFWAIDRIMALDTWDYGTVLREAQAIEAEDRACNERIGAHGAGLVPDRARILTICNTGSLATGGHGTALGIIRTAHAQGKVVQVYACETRPRQQGLRLTAWELLQDQIPFACIADGAAGSLMRAREVDLVVAGADRIAANGDTANKLGTYTLAVLARSHGIPFVIAAPESTLDPKTENGALIPIEERDPTELLEVGGVRVGPIGCPVFNPAFDLTPGKLIDAIVTEQGVHRAPYRFR
ncbi:MAG TPA: S-methyl-5-thioribose-1-phosphate isomerase [Fimbriimonadaceae bacterium]|nr:S-methyl-5-thioribose-1-phosphate isomerase [Fimbriimonadaceae bacterium]